MKITITTILVSKLIAQQFSQWADLTISAIEPGGHDNRTFRLGNEMLVRLPSAACYAEKVHIEHIWLPQLAPHLSVHIPQPVAKGIPTPDYPWHWSVYQWIEGQSADLIRLDETALQQLAKDLAQFLRELYMIPTTHAPTPGTHNFWRGAPPAVYDAETCAAIEKLREIVNPDKALAVWQAALNSHWKQPPVWIHGDLSSGNILINNEKLTAVIDFGGMSVGDPACDLVIAWTLFHGNSRALFKENLNHDANTWARARGWALWKALITLAALEDTKSPQALEQRRIIDELIEEYTMLG